MEGYQIQSVLEILVYSGTFLASLWMITRVFIARRARLGATELRQLVDAIDHVRESVDAMRVDMGDVTERLDFTERVLARMAEEQKTDQRQLPGG